MKPTSSGARAFRDAKMEQRPPAPPSSTLDGALHRVRHFLNLSSRWIVVAVVIAVVAWRHDDQVLWAVTGGILNAGNSKLLKKIFNQQRPLTALELKVDPGMPSSHAQSLGYLSLYAAAGLIFWQGPHIFSIAGAVVIVFCAAYLAWLRISQGLHTPAQVIVGAGFGCSMAGVWIVLWHFILHEAVASSVIVQYSLYSIFCFAVFCFLAFGIRKWRFGEA